MKILVTYLSKTGNTKKIADAIYGEIKEKKEIKRYDKVQSLEGYDLTFVGFPIHGYGPDGKAKKFLENQCKGKKIILFITHASSENHEALPGYLAKFREASEGTDLVGMFNCQGELAKGVKFIMKMMVGNPLRKFALEDNSKGQPDAERVNRAKVFTRDIMRVLYNWQKIGENSVTYSTGSN
ncbi:MAG: flavodoxin domain-containing protein [Armatimonadetes bacterium]|nr:flavodoxin domain-containing protein [Armatimonadota bacterium]